MVPMGTWKMISIRATKPMERKSTPKRYLLLMHYHKNVSQRSNAFSSNILLQDYHTDSRTSSSNLGSFDMKKPLGGLDIQAHPGAHAHAFSQYSQMGMHAAKSHMMGGVAPGGGMTPPTGGSVVNHASHRSPIFPDFFGKMMSISSCQTPSMLPSYYQNSMYSTEKIDSHLWFFFNTNPTNTSPDFFSNFWFLGHVNQKPQ